MEPTWVIRAAELRHQAVKAFRDAKLALDGSDVDDGIPHDIDSIDGEAGDLNAPARYETTLTYAPVLFCARLVSPNVFSVWLLFSLCRWGRLRAAPGVLWLVTVDVLYSSFSLLAPPPPPPSQA